MRHWLKFGAAALAALAVIFAIKSEHGQSLAATTPNSYVVPQVPQVGAAKFVAGTDSPSGTPKVIATGGANGSKCFAGYMTWSDQTATHVVQLSLKISGTVYYGAPYTTSASGVANAFSAPVNIFSPLIWPGLPVDAAGNSYFYLKSGDTLGATFQTNLTTSDEIDIVVFCGDF